MDFFFTAELNGCCVFANGQQNSPVVVHANLSPQELEDVELTGSFEGHGELLRKHQLKVYDKHYAMLLEIMFSRSMLVQEQPWVAFDPKPLSVRPLLQRLAEVRIQTMTCNHPGEPILCAMRETITDFRRQAVVAELIT